MKSNTQNAKIEAITEKTSPNPNFIKVDATTPVPSGVIPL